jgi:hypothetical protein
MPTGVFPRSIEFRRKLAELSWNHQHIVKRIWSKVKKDQGFPDDIPRPRRPDEEPDDDDDEE